jgi:hypothetical protein
MMIEQTVKVGDFLTAASVSIAMLGLVIASMRDRRLKRKEYADRIRGAAGATAVAVERWGELALRLYHDIQALITDADILLVEKRHIFATRDFFWRGLVAARATASGRVLDEKLDSAYVGLYGYAPEVQQLYTSVMFALREADDDAYEQLLNETQDAIMSMEGREPFTSACLGNPLRDVTGICEGRLSERVDHIVAAFRAEMLQLINASDNQIIKKTFPRMAETANHALHRTGAAVTPAAAPSRATPAGASRRSSSTGRRRGSRARR